MVSHGSRHDEGCCLSKSEPNHFFKVILDDTLEAKKLLIPPAFVLQNGHGLSNVAVLKVPNGEEWPVDVLKCNGDVWFCSGWKAFADFYSLGHGDFVVFKDEGNSTFSVIILDKHTCTEIDYPVRIIQETRREKPPLLCSQPRKIRRTESTSSMARASKLPHSVLPDGVDSGVGNLENTQRDAHPPSCTSQPQEANSFSCKMGERKSSRAQRMAERERVKALQGACNFKSKNPFFKVVMQKSHIQKIYSLTVSEFFAAKYFPERRGNVNLCICDGRTWPAKYYTTKCGRRLQTKIFHGWREFAKDMRLELGDVCVFELIDAAKISVSVAIFRHTDLDQVEKGRPTNDQEGHRVTSSEKKVLTEHSGVEAFKGACAFTSENPYFFQIMKPTNVLPTCILTVPASFSNKFFLETKGDVKLCLPEGESWDAKYRCQTFGNHTQVKMAAGWSLFVRENALQVGDGCVFELINTNKITLRVSIFRAAVTKPSNNIGQHSGTKKEMKLAASNNTRQQPSVPPRRDIIPAKQIDDRSFEFQKSVGRQGTTCETVERGNAIQDYLERSERQRVAEAINSLVPLNPYFVQVLKDYHTCRMVMPRDFVRATGLQQKKRIVIKDMAGRVWPVDICVGKKQNFQVCLGPGLSAFLEANRLVAGDTVVFHFMKSIGEIHVQIHSKDEMYNGSRLAWLGQVKSEPDWI